MSAYYIKAKGAGESRFFTSMSTISPKRADGVISGGNKWIGRYGGKEMGKMRLDKERQRG